MLGSGTGFLVFAGAYLYRQRDTLLQLLSVRFVALMVGTVASAFIFVWYNSEFRNRDLTEFWMTDRYQLTNAGITFALASHGWGELLFGQGVGEPITGIYAYFDRGATVVPWLRGSRAAEGFTGLVFHNEYLRIYYNFGVIGLLLVVGVLWSHFRRSGGILLGIALGSLVGSSVYINYIFFTLLLLDWLCPESLRDRPTRAPY
jgi:hypothetical protein